MIVSTRGADLTCTSRGAGPVCMILSAIGTRPHEMQMPDALGERCRLVFVALRGSGQSTGAPGDLTFDRLAEDLDAIRAALGVERFAVLGHSILGALAIEAARRLPERVTHVVAVGTPPFGDMARVGAAAAAFWDADASAERKAVLRENFERLSPGATPGQAMLAETPKRFFDPRFDAAPLFAGAEVRPEFFGHLLGTLTASWDVLGDPRPLRIPLLVAHGRADYVVPATLWDDVLPRLPGARFTLFERSGHQPFVDEPARFVEVVGDFLATQG